MSSTSRSKELHAQIGEERAKGVRQGRMLTGAVLALFALAIGNAWWKVTHFDTEALIAAAEREASKTVWPMVSRELDALAADAVPALSNALAAEASNLLPKINTRLAAESALFEAHVHEKMTASLDAHFAQAAAKRGDRLKERFPQFAADPTRYDALIVRLQKGAQSWAQAQLDTTFAQHIVVLQSINESVAKLQTSAAANPDASGERSMDDVLTLFLEIMNARLDGKG